MNEAFSFDLSKWLPFQDREACERVKAISRKDVTKHKNKNFRIHVIENEEAFHFAYMLDIVSGIKRALEEGRQYTIILPAANARYALAAKMINELNIPCHHVHTFNMDEYADEDGRTAPRTWKGGLQYWMWNDFFGQIRPELRMPEKQIHFPTTETVSSYSRMLEDMGGADKAYGGVGWGGHVAFYEPDIAIRDHGDDMDSFLEQGTCMVDLHIITVCQNCLGQSGDWSSVPPKAATIGPRDLAGAKLVSFWDSLRAGDAVWQRFITRLAAHGPVTPAVPSSMLQVVNSELLLSGPVAADCDTPTGHRLVPIEF